MGTIAAGVLLLGRIDPAPGPTTRGGTTAFGADVGRIDPGRIDRYPDRRTLPVFYFPYLFITVYYAFDAFLLDPEVDQK